MKRRRLDIASRVSDPVRPSEASLTKHSSGYFNSRNNQGRYIFNAIGILGALPFESQVASDFLEPAALSLATAGGPFASCDSLSITNLFDFADPVQPFEFDVISNMASVCWGEISRNLQITAVLAGSIAVPDASLRASTSFNVLPHVDGLRISVSPAWWSRATSFTITGLYYAGQLVGTPLLPAAISVVDINHAPSKAGRIWKSLKAANVAGVITAIKGGGSTEESNVEVCIGCQYEDYFCIDLFLSIRFRARRPCF